MSGLHRHGTHIPILVTLVKIVLLITGSVEVSYTEAIAC